MLYNFNVFILMEIYDYIDILENILICNFIGLDEDEDLDKLSFIAYFIQIEC